MGKVGKDKYRAPSGTSRGSQSQQDIDKFMKKKSSVAADPISKMALLPAPEGEQTEDSEAESLLEQSEAGRPEDSELASRAFIKQTILQAISPVMKELQEIKSDLRHMGQRVDKLETVQSSILTFDKGVRRKFQEQQRQLNAAFTYIEDQENRSRRQNLRIKGLPEEIPHEALRHAADSIFSSLLGPERAQGIVIERIHRALRPKPRTGDPPRDTVCRLLNYNDTADLLRAARSKPELAYEDAKIALFQDIAASTLAKRRTLRPLLEQLRAHNLPYRWLFPFGIAIQKEGKPIIIRSPDDLSGAWGKLGISPIDIPSWLMVPIEDDLPPLPEADKWQTVSYKTRSSRRLRRDPDHDVF